MANMWDCIQLGLSRFGVRQTLDRGWNGRGSDELGCSVLEVIEQLTSTEAKIQEKIAR